MQESIVFKHPKYFQVKNEIARNIFILFNQEIVEENCNNFLKAY